MIEVIETFYRDGTVSAETVGGKQVVQITEHAERTTRDWYNPSMAAYARGHQSHYRMVTTPHAFWIKHSRGVAVAHDYKDAIRVAIHYARRAPK